VSPLALGITISKVKTVSKGLLTRRGAAQNKADALRRNIILQGDASGKEEVGTHHSGWMKASGAVPLLLLE